MKTIREPKKMNARGFSLTELIVVIAIIGIIAAIAGIAAKPWMDKYKVESEIRIMHTDLMNTRVAAMQKNLQYWVEVNAGSYRIIEDTNGDGTPSSGDTWQNPKTLTYTALATGWTGTLSMDTRGIVSDPSNSLMSTQNPIKIRFDTRGTNPVYDCILLSPTRINIGKWGTTCVPR